MQDPTDSSTEIPHVADNPVTIRIATAGWTIRSEFKCEFSDRGSHLERYASRLNAVEINSSFYKPHRLKTYERWAAAVPDNFRFAVKMPKAITHSRMLVDVTSDLERFLSAAIGLGKKLEIVLVQLPPKLRFIELKAVQFFTTLKRLYAGRVACEPRHLSWFDRDASRVLTDFDVSRVAADPSINQCNSVSTASTNLAYFRWHGSPEIYYSSYSYEQLSELAQTARALEHTGMHVWCVFDNTARGAATLNALHLRTLLTTTSK